MKGNYLSLKQRVSVIGKFCPILYFIVACCLILDTSNRAYSQSAANSELKQLYQSEAVAGSQRLHHVEATDYHYDAGYYGLHLTIWPDSQKIAGYLAFRATVTQATSSILLDMGQTIHMDSVVTSDGTHLVFQRNSSDVQQVVITLDHQKVTGDGLDWRLYYHGKPAEAGDGSFYFGENSGEPIVWTLSEPFGASDWFPCKNTPADKADSSEVFITVPSPLKVASNGLLISVENLTNGWLRYHWKEHYRIAPYLISLAIADYNTFTDWFRYSQNDSMPVVNYIYQTTDEAYVKQQTKDVIRALSIYSKAYGPYPFLKEKYGQAEFTWNGGMEHQTMTSLGSFSTSVVVHELAHQWFGDAVTCDTWQDIWLNEGFATFSEGLYKEKTEGEKSYQAWLGSLEKVVMEQPGGYLYIPETQLALNNQAASNRIFDSRLSYDKGAVVLHMLRYVLGDSLFFSSLRHYVEGPLRYGSATTQDFEQSVEKTTGQNLSWFFNQWVYGQGYPVYTINYGYAGKHPPFKALVSLHQDNSTGDSLFFRMPVKLRFEASGVDTTFTVWNNKQDQDYTFELPFLPLDLRLDPDNDFPDKVKDSNPFSGDQHTDYQLPHHPYLNPNYPNPFNPSTNVSFYMDRGGQVKVRVYDVTGRLVATLVNSYLDEGYHVVRWNASGLASGMYFIRLQSLGYIEIKKALLMR